MVFVTGRGKSAIEDHFDIAYELETTMAHRGKSLDLLDPDLVWSRAPSPMSASRSRWAWATPCGALATSSATSPSRCCLPTISWSAEPGCLKQMVDAYMQVGGNMICAGTVSKD